MNSHDFGIYDRPLPIFADASPPPRGERERKAGTSEGRQRRIQGGRVNKLGICKKQFTTAAPIFCEAYSQNLSQNPPSSAHFHRSKALGQLPFPPPLPASFVFSLFRSTVARRTNAPLFVGIFSANENRSRACAISHAMPQKKTGGIFEF